MISPTINTVQYICVGPVYHSDVYHPTECDSMQHWFAKSEGQNGRRVGRSTIEEKLKDEMGTWDRDDNMLGMRVGGEGGEKPQGKRGEGFVHTVSDLVYFLLLLILN